MKFLFMLFAAMLIAPFTYAQLSTSKLFGNHMVLQRNHPVPVWGHSDKKAKVTVILNGQVVSAKADEAGNRSDDKAKADPSHLVPPVPRTADGDFG